MVRHTHRLAQEICPNYLVPTPVLASKPEEMSDPTRIEIRFDPQVARMTGRAYHGNTPFDVPFISEIAPNLWQGGCETGLVLPDFVEHVVSLYPWESYTVNHNLSSRLEVRMYDSTDQEFDQVDGLAFWVNLCRQTGPVLVHCQAGLNRSSLVGCKSSHV